MTEYASILSETDRKTIIDRAHGALHRYRETDHFDAPIENAWPSTHFIKETEKFLREKAEKESRIFDLGIGTSLMSHGFHGNYPTLAIRQAPEPGTPGDTSPEFEGLMQEGTTYIRFHNPDAVERFVETINSMLESVFEIVSEDAE